MVHRFLKLYFGPSHTEGLDTPVIKIAIVMYLFIQSEAIFTVISKFTGFLKELFFFYNFKQGRQPATLKNAAGQSWKQTLATLPL